MNIKNYQDLQVWQKGRALVSIIYKITHDFPKHEQYGITQQIQRAAVSVPANIAEGSSKRSTAEFIRFLNIAYGSLSEVETFLFLSKDLGYIDDDELSYAIDLTSELGRMLNGLINKLEEKRAG